jgi:AcrR family transcriptional regulator
VPPATEPTTREALLDAAYDAIVAGTWQKARMADVAAAAGVSRQTLYNAFGGKDALAQALTLREAERFLDAVDDALVGHDGTPAEAVGFATATSLRLAARATPILDVARARIVERVHTDWPELDLTEVETVAETVVRLTVSYLVLPTDAVDLVAQRVSHLVERMLVPANRRQS